MERTKERILLNEQDKDRHQAVSEIMALNLRYEGSFYTFEYGGQVVTARYVSACLQSNTTHSSGYYIELLAASETLVDGACVITGMDGRKMKALAFTSRGTYENLITIRTVPQNTY